MKIAVNKKKVMKISKNAEEMMIVIDLWVNSEAGDQI